MTSHGVTYDAETGKFSGGSFDSKTINSNSNEYSVYDKERDTWITGITVEGEGDDAIISNVAGAQGRQGNYTFTIESAGEIDTWKDRVADKSWNLMGSLGGKTVMTSHEVTYDAETGKFSGGSFDTETINSNSDKYSVYDKERDTWITGITVEGEGDEAIISNVAGAQGRQGNYTFTIESAGEIDTWKDRVADKSWNLMGSLGGKTVMTSHGVTYDASTGKFSGGSFDSETINSNSREYSVYDKERDTWITGITVEGEGDEAIISNIDGAQGRQGNYTFVIKDAGNIDTWKDRVAEENQNLMGSLGGRTVMTSYGVTYDKNTGKFSGGSFDSETINSNSNEYSVYDKERDTWITGITVEGEGDDAIISNVAGAQGRQGDYIFTIETAGEIDTWKDRVDLESSKLYLVTNNGVKVVTGNGVTFNSDTGKFSGGTFGDSTKNVAILGDGSYVFGVKVENGNAYYQDSIIQTDRIETAGNEPAVLQMKAEVNGKLIDGDNWTEYMDLYAEPKMTQEVLDLSDPKYQPTTTINNEEDWFGGERIDFTTTYYMYDKNGKIVKIDVNVFAEEQSYLVCTDSTQRIEVYVDGELVDSDEDSGLGWFTWSGRGQDAMDYANGVLGDYHFTDTYTVSVAAVPNNDNLTATTAILDVADLDSFDKDALMFETVIDTKKLDALGNPQLLSFAFSEITAKDVEGISYAAQATSTYNMIANADAFTTKYSYTYDDDGVRSLSRVSQYDSELFIVNNTLYGTEVISGLSQNVKEGILDTDKAVMVIPGISVRDDYQEQVWKYVSSSPDMRDNCYIMLGGEKLVLYYDKNYVSEGGNNSENKLYFDIEGRTTTTISAPSTTLNSNDKDYDKYEGTEYYDETGRHKTISMEDALKRAGYDDVISYTTTSYEGYTSVTMTRGKSLSIGDVSLSAEFEGNDSKIDFTVDGIVFDSNKGFTVTAGINLTENPFIVEGDIVIPEAGDGGNNNSPDVTNKVLYEVGAYIDGNHLELTSIEGSTHDSKVAVTFGLSELMGSQSGLAISDYSFAYFYAGTNLSFVAPSTLISDNSLNRTDIKNRSVDEGYVTNQVVQAEVSGGTCFLNTDTSLSQLAITVINNGLLEEDASKGIVAGNIVVTNTFDYVSKDGKTTSYKISADMASGTNWESANKNYYQLGNSGTDYVKLTNGSSFMGGTLDTNKNSVDYGGFLGWNGDIKINNGVTNFAVEKNGFVRTVECAWGVVVSVTAIASFGMFDIEGGKELLRYSASLLGDKQIGEVTTGEMVSAAFSGVAAIAAVAVTVLSAGTAAPALVAAVAAVAAVSAGQSAFKASESFQRWGESGFKDVSYLLDGVMNTIFCATAIFGGAQFLSGLEAVGITSMQTMGQVAKELVKSPVFWKTVATRAVIGAGVGAGAGLTVQLIANNGDWSKVNWWGVAAFAGIGALTGAVTTNIGNVMVAGNIGEVGNLLGAVEHGIIGSEKMLQAFKFTNTIVNIGKNTLMANTIIKPLLKASINNLTNMSSSEKAVVYSLFSSAIDTFMFMSAVGLNTGKALDLNIIKELNLGEGAKNFGLIGNIANYGFGNAIRILGYNMAGTVGGLKGVFKNGLTALKNIGSHPISSLKNGVRDAWNYMRNTTLTNRGIVGGLIGGSTGGVAGGFIGGALDGDDDTWWSWQGAAIGAGIGTIVGGGLGNLAANGGTTTANTKGVLENLKAAYSGTAGTLASNLNPTNLFTNNVEMISRIISFRLTTTGLGAVADVLTNGKSTEFLKGTLIGKLDSWMSDQGVGLGLINSIDDLASGLKDSEMTLTTLANFSVETNATISSPEMWMFGLATGALQPLLGPILVNSPILGTVMQPITKAGGIFENNATLSMMYEEGFQEGVSGLFGKLLFGDSAAGEIFQELFDQTPEFNVNGLLASANINKNTITTNSNSVNTARTKLADTLRGAGLYGSSYGGGISQATFAAYSQAGSLKEGIDILLNDATIPQATRDSIKTSYDNYVSTIQSGLADLGVSAENIEAIMPYLSTQMYLGSIDVSKAMIAEAVIARVEAGGMQMDTAARNAIRSSLFEMNTSGMNINQVINGFYASIVAAPYKNGSSFDVSNVSKLMGTTEGISILANYINSLSAKGNNAELGEILNAINETLRSDDYTNNVTKTNELLLQTQMLLNYVSTYDVVKNIPKVTEIKDKDVNFDRMIGINKATIISELTASMTSITNQVAESYLKTLEEQIGKLNNSDLSAAEKAYYDKLKDILGESYRKDHNLTATQISQILNTNDAQLFAQTTRSERKKISGIRNELRGLANNILSEQIQLGSVVLNDMSTDSYNEDGLQLKSLLQIQTMGLSDINIAQFSISDLIEVSNNYNENLMAGEYILAKQAMENGDTGKAVEYLKAIYGNDSFVFNKENGTITIKNSEGKYNVQGDIVTVTQENFKFAFDLITKFGGVETLDLRCISTSEISNETRTESFRQLITSIGLQNVVNTFGIENISVSAIEAGNSSISATITVNGVVTTVNNIQLTSRDIANIANSADKGLLEKLIDADKASIESDLLNELKGQNAIRDIIGAFEGTGWEADNYKDLREMLITSVDTLGRASYGSELYNSAKQQLLDTLTKMSDLNTSANRGTNAEKIGAIAQTILDSGNITDYDNYREVKKKIDEIDSKLKQETDPNIQLELLAQRTELKQNNGVDQSVDERFEIQKQRYMNGHATDFLNRFSITENIFRNSPVYQQLQQYSEFSGEYEGFGGYRTSIIMSDMDIAIFAESLRLGELTVESIESLIKDLEAEYDAINSASNYEEAVDNAKKSKKYREGTGYTTYEALIPRLRLLQQVVQSGKMNDINSKYEEATSRVNKFLESQGMKFENGRILNSEGKTLSVNSIDEFMSQLEAQNLSAEDMAMTMRVFAQECVRGAFVFNNGDESKAATEAYSLRASQTEMVSAFLRGENIALGMGGGKTVAYCADAIIHRMILGQNANIEILVGNDDPANFVSEKSQARKILEFAGMRTQNLNDFKAEGQSTDISGLREAYADANTVMIVTPTTKAHMLNEAVSMGVSGMELTDILNSVNRVLADEIHLWALTTTAAVIGGNNNPPSAQLINDMLSMADRVDAGSIIQQLEECKNSGIPRTDWKIEVEIDGKATVIQFFNEYSDASAFMAEQNNKGVQAIAVIGEMSSKTNIKMSDSLRNALSDIDTGNLSSVLRGLFANTDKGGMAISKIDGKVKPMGDAIQENMVIGDIYLQMGFALRCALNGSVSDAIKMNDRKALRDFISNSTQTSDTSMQTSLAALYAGSNAKIVGGSGTVSGLEQLIIGRSGASIVRNITGEMVNQKDFKTTTDSTEKVVNDILGRVSGGGKYDNALFLAKTDANVVNITNAVQGRIAELIDAGFEVYVFAGQQQGVMNREGKIEATDEKLTDIAKDSSRKRIIIANEFGMTGIDYQGKFELGQWDAHLMTNADLAQSIKRTGRPGGETGRWETERTLVFNNEAFQSQITEFSANSDLLRAARELWSGARAQDMAGNGYLSNERALEIANALESNGWNIEQLLQTGDYSQGDIVEFVSNIQTLYAVDASVRFALNDSMRDKMLLSVLRELKQMTTGEERELVSQILNEALQKGTSSADFEYKTDSGSQTASEVISSSFDRIYQEAMSRLSSLKGLSGAAGVLLNAHLNELQLVNDNYKHIDAIKSKGLSDTFDMTEFMGVIKSFEDYILPIRSDTAKQKATTAEQLITTNTTQESLRQELIDTLEQDSSLGHIDESGNIELTTRGRTYVELANRRLMSEGDDDWVRFFEWLCSLLGIDLDDKTTNGSRSGTVAATKILATSLESKGFENIDKLGQIFDTFKQQDLTNDVSYGQIKHIYNAQKNPIIQKILAQNKLSLPGNYENTISLAETYKSILEKKGDTDSEIYRYVSGIVEAYDEVVSDAQKILQMSQQKKGLNFISVNRAKKDLKDSVKEMNEKINPKLSDISQETNTDLKVRMATAGIPITANTDTAIANMKAYIGSLKEKEAEAVSKELKLSDMNRFADMPKMIYDLAQAGLITLSDKERYVLNGLLGSNRFGMVSTVNNGDVRIGNIRNLMEQTRGTEEKPIDLTLPSDEEILEIAARMTHPTQAPKVFADRYNFVMDNVELDVIDAMSLSVIADGDNFVTGKDDKIVSTWKGFEEEYERLLKATTIGEIVDTENEAIKYRRAADIMDTYGEAKYKKLVSAYRQFERTVGRDRVLDIMKSPYSEKVSEAETEAYDLYLKKIMDQGVEDYQNIAQRLAYNKVTGNNEIANDIEGRGIKYNKAKENYNKLLEFFKGKDIPEEEAKKLAGSFTLEEMASETFTGELEALIDSGLITVDKDSTRDGIYGKIKGLTPSQIRDEKLEKQLEEKKLTTIETVLEATGLDMENVRENNEKVFNWLSESELLEELDGVIKFDTELTLGQLSDGKKVREMMKVTADEHIKDMYMGKSYAALVEEIGEDNLDKFAAAMGIDGVKGNRETVEKAVGEALKERDISIKEHNETVARVVGAMSVEDLSNSEYVGGVATLISKGVITAADIMSGKAIGTIMREKKEGETRAKVGEKYNSVMAAVGLGAVVENKNKLEEKYSSEVERAVISEMAISELADTEKVKALIEDDKAMEARVMKFGETLTMNKAKEISTREGINLVEMIKGATDYLGYALYDKRAEELREYIDVDNLPIKAILDNENVVEEVKGLTELEVDKSEIETIVKEAGKAKSTAEKAIKGRSVADFERLTGRMTEEQKERLYKYLGIDKKTLEKKIKELKAKLGVPEGLAMEEVSVEDVYGIKDMKTLASRTDRKVNRESYREVTIDKYLGMSEEERARYGADQGKIDTRIRELVSGDEVTLKGYIVGSMSIENILGSGVAEGKIKELLDKGTDQAGLKRYYSKTRQYYEQMSGEDFMKATEEISGVNGAKVNKAKAREGILGDDYATFMKNYYSLSRATSFGEVVKKVGVEVLKSERAKKSIEAIAGDGKLTEKQVEEIVLVIEESKEEDTRGREVLGRNIKPVLEEAQVVRKTDTEDCVDVAVETMGKIIPLRALTQAALKATPYVQDKLKAAGVGDTLEGTELGELRQRTGLSYATMRERDIDLTKIKSKEVSEEKPLVMYMSKTGHAVAVTEISDGLVMYKRVDSKGQETEEIKSIKEFNREEGSQGIVLSKLTTPFVAYMENEESDIGHVVTVTKISGGYVTYTGTDANDVKVEETIPVEKFFKEDGFSGLILTPKREKEVVYLDSGVKGVVSEMFKRAKSNKYGDGKEMLEKIIDGVTAPGELNKALKYVLSIWDKDATAMMEYIELKEKDLGDKEAIIQNATRKITEAIALGKEGKLSEAEVKVEIELVTTLRDLLITAGTDKKWLSNASEEEIMSRLIVSKAVNQNVIVNMFDKALDPSVSGSSKDDFVIDVKKLQSTIVDKNLKFAKDAKIEDVMELLAGADKRYKTPMMSFNLRNIHAVAAAA